MEIASDHQTWQWKKNNELKQTKCAGVVLDLGILDRMLDSRAWKIRKCKNVKKLGNQHVFGRSEIIGCFHPSHIPEIAAQSKPCN